MYGSYWRCENQLSQHVKNNQAKYQLALKECKRKSNKPQELITM